MNPSGMRGAAPNAVDASNAAAVSVMLLIMTRPPVENSTHGRNDVSPRGKTSRRPHRGVRYRAVFDFDQRGHTRKRPIRGPRRGRFLAPATAASSGAAGCNPSVLFAHLMSDGGSAIAARPEAGNLHA